MATGDSYSRLVQVAKIILPLTALAILSTLFLISGNINPEGAVPYSEIDVEEAAREQRITNPRYATVGEDGAAIELSAREAKPNPDNELRLDAIGIAGSIEVPGGLKIELSAGGGTVDLDNQTAGLVGQVLVSATSGYKIEAEALLARLDRAELVSEGPVSVETPFGALQAGNMALTQKGEDYRLVFNNKVKLVYHP